MSSSRAMQRLCGLMRKAVQDYEMIAPGDRIAVGVSGGKDSLTLLVALAKLRAFYPKPFTVEAITLDMGHADGIPAADFAQEGEERVTCRWIAEKQREG